MSPNRLALKRVAAIAFAIALLAPALVAQAATEPATVTGALTIKEKVTLGPDAVAVVVLVDRTAANSGGQIIGVQRIDAPGNSPISFSVPFDSATIQPTHAYAVFASLQDHEKIWQSLEPTPVITGGPTSNVLLTLEAVPAKPAAVVSGTIQTADLATIPGATVVIAALVKVQTGTIVASQVQTTPSSASAEPSPSAPAGLTALPFSIGYEPDLIDPAATYVVRAAVIAGPQIWSAGAGAPVITNGAPTSRVELNVALSPTPLPTPQPTATPNPTRTPRPTATPEPTAAPTESARPTANPSPTPKPTPKPTATPAPTPSPTPSPTPPPTPSPTPAPTPSPTPPPTPEPNPGSHGDASSERHGRPVGQPERRNRDRDADLR